MRRFRPLAPLLLAFAVFLGGCATADSLRNDRERPESLTPVPLDAAPERVYDEALTLAFDRGYQIVYSDDRDRLIELEAFDERLFFHDRVLRIDLLVRAADGQTRLHTRVHSLDLEDPSDMGVRDDDRAAARELIDHLLFRLDEPPLPAGDGAEQNGAR